MNDSRALVYAPATGLERDSARHEAGRAPLIIVEHTDAATPHQFRLTEKPTDNGRKAGKVAEMPTTQTQTETPDAGTIARQIWATFNDNERFGAKFAMFPADKMKPADATGRAMSHEITVILMQLASGKAEA
jgi:hypothetical protein